MTSCRDLGPSWSQLHVGMYVFMTYVAALRLQDDPLEWSVGADYSLEWSVGEPGTDYSLEWSVGGPTGDQSKGGNRFPEATLRDPYHTFRLSMEHRGSGCRLFTGMVSGMMLKTTPRKKRPCEYWKDHVWWVRSWDPLIFNTGTGRLGQQTHPPQI